jgi:hypothetical protein
MKIHLEVRRPWRRARRAKPESGRVAVHLATHPFLERKRSNFSTPAGAPSGWGGTRGEVPGFVCMSALPRRAIRKSVRRADPLFAALWEERDLSICGTVSGSAPAGAAEAALPEWWIEFRFRLPGRARWIMPPEERGYRSRKSGPLLLKSCVATEGGMFRPFWSLMTASRSLPSC